MFKKRTIALPHIKLKFEAKSKQVYGTQILHVLYLYTSNMLELNFVSVYFLNYHSEKVNSNLHISNFEFPKNIVNSNLHISNFEFPKNIALIVFLKRVMNPYHKVQLVPHYSQLWIWV